MPNRTNTTNMGTKHAVVDGVMTFGLGVVIMFFAVTGFVAYTNNNVLKFATAQVTSSHDSITALNDVLSSIKDAETGQRGYVITGEDRYLEPYTIARAEIDSRIARLDGELAAKPEQMARLSILKKHITNKLRELEQTIATRRTQGFDAARDVVMRDSGKVDMDTIRSTVRDIRQAESTQRDLRIGEMRQAFMRTLVSSILTAVIGLFLATSIAYLIRRTVVSRRREAWLQTGQAGLSSAMLGDQDVKQLGDSILKFLSEYFGAHVGAFYAKSGNRFLRMATYGVPADSPTPEDFVLGETLLGQAAKDKRAFYLSDVPDGYLSFGSALGQSKPRYLAIAPALSDGEVNAVFELGFVHKANAETIKMLEIASESIGVAVRSANYRGHLQDLLEETQRQSEELQTQSEELRVSNEELEEQSTALKSSQQSLQQQQAELEQANSQLEEQTQILEAQRDDLQRAKAIVQVKAQELEQASQYKSDFLANMSHELRTPLNSSLILAKLLADNKEGNLTDEQIKFAQTIQAAGNDLLTLINDILDLSKIEAGHMDVNPAPVELALLASDSSRIFEPLAQQKGLKFETRIAPNAPEYIETDRQRLEQVLKNLLSNAIKFTDKGSVILNIGKTADGKVSFAVTDTGIGISPDQQRLVFDAFRQADSTISRKYGGTGLGLSISRELTRLLGGTIDLTSEAGKGSTFSITLPVTYDADLVRPQGEVMRPSSPPQMISAPALAETAIPAAPPVPDDRSKLTAGKRTILVIEDDASFAKILYDLAHEQGFQCILCNTAEDGWLAVRQYMPSAVLLDVGLPDHSGLSVLDRLKHDARTRHIPVHVLSANDYSQTALSLGAVGYMLKPVKREDLMGAFEKLETRMNHHMRRVLVVEDDQVQRESVTKLLASHEVEVVAVGTAAECLERLKATTFDCMVLDLSLPDASGYSLLETLAQTDAYSFPPVIVYTGRDLSESDEQKLRRYSKSIIIKGAKSPERLLDEVTLFLHQVESELPAEQQRMLERARHRDSILEGRRILLVEDDIRNVYAVTNIFEPHGAVVQIARNGREALEVLAKSKNSKDAAIDIVLMDVMMPEMDGITATREIRKDNAWRKLPVIMLTAKAMKDDQEKCLAAGANDYMAKPLDVEKLLSLVRVWMPR